MFYFISTYTYMFYWILAGDYLHHALATCYLYQTLMFQQTWNRCYLLFGIGQQKNVCRNELSVYLLCITSEVFIWLCHVTSVQYLTVYHRLETPQRYYASV
jgi:hypothetical protein